MALDARYMLAPSLEQYFVDKDTGLPLNGTVSFYVDTARTTPKDVFILSGSPPNYSYTNIGSVVDISGGVLTYNNTNIQIYYYPFESDSTTVELYYAVIESTDGVTQFTREGWPNFSEATTTEDDPVNFIPNGQFLLHNDLPDTDLYDAGEIRADVTDVAYGGWTYERTGVSGAKDLVLFQRNGSYITNPTSNPRYNINVICETPGIGYTAKDLCVKFNDVNKFASATTEYTFYFEGRANSGSSNVDIVLIKNFGSGGSTPTETTITTFTLTASMASYLIAFNFGTNDSKTIGAGNDDYLQLAFRFATGNQFNIELTDVGLLPNALATIPVFPIATTSQVTYRSLAGFMPIPAYDGSELYLMPQLTASGFRYDTSEIGKVFMDSAPWTSGTSLSVDTNLMLSDGSQYETVGYSDLGIPFSRLQAKYWSSTLNLPVYGTGAEYFIGIFSGTGNELRIDNNSAGAVTDTVDGATPTGFTFTTIHTGASYSTKAYLVAASQFYIEDIIGLSTAAGAGTTTFTVATVQTGSALLPEISSITTVAGSSITGGQYFIFSSTTVDYYVWFKIDGAGADPVVASRTGILISLNSTDTDAVVAQKIRESLNGWQVTTIATVAASAMASGDYFTLNSTTLGYFVWYEIDGAGAEPVVAGRTPIKVAILSSDTNTQVATKTQIAINQKFFAVPNFQGMFLRGWNNSSGNDPDAATRWSLVPGVIGDMLGSFQESANLSHRHPVPVASGEGGGQAFDQGIAEDGTVLSHYDGGHESRPYNTYVNYVIKY